MKPNPQFDPPEVKAARRGAKRRQAITALVETSKGKPGITWRDWLAGRTLIAIHDGRGAEGGHSAVSLVQTDLRDLVDKLTEQLVQPEKVPVIAREVRIAVEDKRWEIERLNGELQVLRFRIMHLERDAAERVPCVRLVGYSDATALVLAACTALAVREERAS